MFSKLSILLVTVLAGFVAAQTSDPLCCDNVVPATSSQAQEFLDLAGIFLTNYDINIGLLCFPSDAGVWYNSSLPCSQSVNSELAAMVLPLSAAPPPPQLP
ncbi:hypothetical protein B0H16DRAFT_1455246 [Mycena metata]|uniref:Hydrophobin n=1 Tax=Mycena metata TaxID=1033252 RepID=A0AAD7JHC6_9AGAR|nr:hypothetical protein B0H16DRAFT_1455246 [Mycena metata]